MCDDSKDRVLWFIATHIVAHDLDAILNWILENSLEAAEQEMTKFEREQRAKMAKETEKEKKARERVIQKYHETPDLRPSERTKHKSSSLKKLDKARAKHQPPESKVRYLDGKVVAMNGARFIEVKREALDSKVKQ